jgi:hypothetical protein
MRGLWPLYISVILLFVALTVGWLSAFRAFGWAALVIGLMCFTGVWVLVELLTGVVFYTYGEIICESKRKDA